MCARVYVFTNKFRKGESVCVGVGIDSSFLCLLNLLWGSVWFGDMSDGGQDRFDGQATGQIYYPAVCSWCCRSARCDAI